MNRIIAAGLAVAAVTVIAVAVATTKFGPKSSTEAIREAETYATFEQKGEYLVRQAQRFVGAKNYDDAIKTVEYILANADPTSARAQEITREARRLLAQARERLTEGADQILKEAGSAATEAKQELFGGHAGPPEAE
ncbi:MAG: hypothetical protein NC910_00375 [Candidatus Omnitrophica bacterium]|nr:hypothetical protein [Candidatus Omnitrophota bacterium]